MLTALETGVKDELLLIAKTLVNYSPVESGAYVESHNFSVNNQILGKGFTRRGKPKVNVNVARNKALNKLRSQINSFNLDSADKIYFTNDAPHVNKVEYINNGGYYVYTKARNIHG